MSRKIEIQDLLQFHFLASPALSPDGALCVYKVSRADKTENRYLSDLWVYDLEKDQNRQITFSGREKSFAWSCDGKSLLLLSDREQPAKGESRIYSLPLDGGEARLLYSLKLPVSSIVPLDDGTMILQAETAPQFANPEEADYMRFEQIPFTSNGKAYIGQKRGALFRLGIAGELQRLTPELMDTTGFRASADGKKLLAWGPVFKDVKPLYETLIEVDLLSGENRILLKPGKITCKCADYFDNGILIVGSAMDRHGLNQNCHFYTFRNGTLQDLTPAMDRSLTNSINCDCRYGLRNWSNTFKTDGTKAWFLSTVRDSAKLCSIDAAGSVRELNLPFIVDDFDIVEGKAVCVGLQGTALQELYAGSTEKFQRISSHNAAFMESHTTSTPCHVEIPSGCDKIDGWYMLPAELLPEEKKLPMILHIHGGPKTAFGAVYHHEMQCWAARGFIVLYCNPHGSDGRGDSFADIRGKYGTIDYDDLMAAVDWALEHLPVDPHRLAVTGGSYGGFMTNWIIGHTDRFHAAVTQRSICNWISFSGSSDIGYYFGPDQMDAGIWTDTEKMWFHSPLKYAANFKTPTLVIHSDEDFRCELNQGIQMFHALKLQGVESALCVFKGDSHELSRSGHPRSRLARMREISDWIASHLSCTDGHSKTFL